LWVELGNKLWTCVVIHMQLHSRKRIALVGPCRGTYKRAEVAAPVLSLSSYQYSQA